MNFLYQLINQRLLGQDNYIMENKYSRLQLISLLITILLAIAYFIGLINNNIGSQIVFSVLLLYIFAPINLLSFGFSLNDKKNSKNTGKIFLFETIIYAMLLTNILIK